MAKEKITITLDNELIEQTKLLQEQLAGCHNISSLIEKLLIQWITNIRGEQDD